MNHGRDREQRAQEADDVVLRAYDSTRRDGPPPHVDTAVKARAREALRSRRAAPRWWIPASLAATVLLAFTVVLQVDRQTGREAVPSDAAAPAELASAESAAESPSGDAHSASGMPARIAPATPPPAADREPTDAASGPASLAAPPPPPAAAREAPIERRAAPAPMSAASAPAGELPSPEDWLRRIEELEAQSLHEAAEAERARLEQAYPGWLEQRERSPK